MADTKTERKTQSGKLHTLTLSLSLSLSLGHLVSLSDTHFCVCALPIIPVSDGASTTRQSSTLFSNRQPALVSSPTVASGTFGKQKTQTFAKIVVLFGFFSIVRLCYGIGNVDVGYNLASFVFFCEKID